MEFMNFLISKSLGKSRKVSENLAKSRKVSTHGHALSLFVSLFSFLAYLRAKPAAAGGLACVKTNEMQLLMK